MAFLPEEKRFVRRLDDLVHLESKLWTKYRAMFCLWTTVTVWTRWCWVKPLFEWNVFPHDSHSKFAAFSWTKTTWLFRLFLLLNALPQVRQMNGRRSLVDDGGGIEMVHLLITSNFESIVMASDFGEQGGGRLIFQWIEERAGIRNSSKGNVNWIPSWKREVRNKRT